MEPPKAVFFDWDGTIVDSLQFIVDGHNHVRAHFALPSLSRSEVLEMMASGASKGVMKTVYGDRSEEAREIYYSHVNAARLGRVDVLPGVQRVFEYLSDRGIAMGIVTNMSRELLDREIAHLGWQGRFISTVAADEAPRNKPHPDPLLRAITQGGFNASVDANAIWYVGDMETDLMCARESGCPSIYLNEEGKAPSPDLSPLAIFKTHPDFHVWLQKTVPCA